MLGLEYHSLMVRTMLSREEEWKIIYKHKDSMFSDQ
jgi:hypothetical protein